MLRSFDNTRMIKRIQHPYNISQNVAARVLAQLIRAEHLMVVFDQTVPWYIITIIIDIHCWKRLGTEFRHCANFRHND